VSASTWEATLPTEAETLALGRRLGAVAEAGDVIALHGDLGAGKTCFARGFAAGLGVPNLRDVTSPTFALWNVHEGGAVTMHHVDLYRVANADEAWSLGLEEVLGGDGVCLVEWPSRAPELFGPETVHLSLSVVAGGRHVTIRGNGGPTARCIAAARQTG
jgi:tRNA threonylcarbamoyladenosine biosynthesis protein TsaE